eukprot:365943-Chlamydomonas_euryale.AAC.3
MFGDWRVRLRTRWCFWRGAGKNGEWMWLSTQAQREHCLRRRAPGARMLCAWGGGTNQNLASLACERTSSSSNLQHGRKLATAGANECGVISSSVRLLVLLAQVQVWWMVLFATAVTCSRTLFSLPIAPGKASSSIRRCV